MSQLAVGVPRAVAWRRRVRRARRRHRWRSLGETLSNLYMLLWLVGVYGVGLLPALREHFRTVRTLPAAAASARYWIVVAVLLAGARPARPAIRAGGPPLAPPHPGGVAPTVCPPATPAAHGCVPMIRLPFVPLAAALVDIDHFQLINGTLGHDAGDEALQAVDEVVEMIGESPLAGTLAVTTGSLGPALAIALRTTGSRRIAAAFPAVLVRLELLRRRHRGARVSAIWSSGSPDARASATSSWMSGSESKSRRRRYVAARRCRRRSSCRGWGWLSTRRSKARSQGASSRSPETTRSTAPARRRQAPPPSSAASTGASRASGAGP